MFILKQILKITYDYFMETPFLGLIDIRFD